MYQNVMDLAGQPGAFVEGGGAHLRVPTSPDLAQEFLRSCLLHA